MASSLSSGRPNSLAGTGNKTVAGTKAGSEFLDCLRFCAMFDKPYIARYERKAGGLLQLVGTFKDEATAGAGKGRPSTVVLPFSEIKGPSKAERCAWCGIRDTIVFCTNCSSFICRAQVSKRDGGLYFRCRKSCNYEAMIGSHVELFEASKGIAPSRKPNPAALLVEKGSAVALPSGQLRLKS